MNQNICKQINGTQKHLPVRTRNIRLLITTWLSRHIDSSSANVIDMNIIRLGEMSSLLCIIVYTGYCYNSKLSVCIVETQKKGEWIGSHFHNSFRYLLWFCIGCAYSVMRHTCLLSHVEIHDENEIKTYVHHIGQPTYVYLAGSHFIYCTQKGCNGWRYSVTHKPTLRLANTRALRWLERTMNLLCH